MVTYEIKHNLGITSVKICDIDAVSLIKNDNNDGFISIIFKGSSEPLSIPMEYSVAEKYYKELLDEINC